MTVTRPPILKTCQTPCGRSVPRRAGVTRVTARRGGPPSARMMFVFQQTLAAHVELVGFVRGPLFYSFIVCQYYTFQFPDLRL